MHLIDRVMNEPELVAEPPILVDVGAAGGMHAAWKKLAPYSICLSFEPDSREAPAARQGDGGFRKWIFSRGLAVASVANGKEQLLYLTRSPQCSSTLEPDTQSLREWSFASLFDVVDAKRFQATTVMDALRANGLSGIDWLKCDTQGLDLRLFLSLSEEVRRRLLCAEFEPGLMAAYKGEDHLAEVLSAMKGLPFWLSEMEVGKVPRASPELIARVLGPKAVTWVRRLGRGVSPPP